MSRNRFIALSIFVDAVLVNVGFVLAFLLRFEGRLPAFNFQAYLLLAPLLTVPPGDVAALAAALNRLLGDDELRARLGRQAQARALREFTVPRMVARTLDVYAEAAARHAARAAVNPSARRVAKRGRG